MIVALPSVAWGQEGPAGGSAPGGQAPAQTAPSAAASAPPEGAGQTIFFAPDDRASGWTLLPSQGTVALCTLPCSYPLDGRQGYRLRSPTGAETTFFGYEAAGSTRATIRPPTGSRFLAGVTIVASVVVGGVGAALYFAGNTQKCAYGAMTDENGNITYAQTVDGTCASTKPPLGYDPGTGVDQGASTSGNQKTGIAMMILGGAGLVGGGVWFFLSRGGPEVAWGGSTGSAPKRELHLGLNPSGMTLQGSF
jgi:hypothetical protein